MAKEAKTATEVKKPARARKTTETKKAPEAKAPEAKAPEGPRQLPEYLHSRRTEVGRVVSDKMEKTVVVVVERRKPHPIYKKVMRRSVKFMAHDEMGSGEGDTVRIIESRPMSAHKRWQVIEIIAKAEKI
jgi:small subunit ribosomal protein S17